MKGCWVVLQRLRESVSESLVRCSVRAPPLQPFSSRTCLLYSHARAGQDRHQGDLEGPQPGELLGEVRWQMLRGHLNSKPFDIKIFVIAGVKLSCSTVCTLNCANTPMHAERHIKPYLKSKTNEYSNARLVTQVFCKQARDRNSS